jgi:hypothetical protein
VEKPLHPCADIHIDRFPMPDARNPYLGLDHFEDDPVISKATGFNLVDGLSSLLKTSIDVMKIKKLMPGFSLV